MTVSGATPDSATQDTTLDVVINGSGFGATPGTARVGGNVLTSPTWTDTQIIGTIPPGHGLSLPVTVTVALATG